MTGTDPGALLEHLDLTEYETNALATLFSVGRTTAPDLAEATGIPKARIYSVLDELADAGYIKVIPGRPKEYDPKHPDEVLDRAIENERQSFASYRAQVEEIHDEFVERFEPMYESSSRETTAAEELFYVVDVGEPSIRETRRLYRHAAESIAVVTKAFEYFDEVEPEFKDAVNSGCAVSVLFLHPRHLTTFNADVQQEVVAELRSKYPSVEIRFSNERLPWRGTVVDPSMDYESGQAVMLVEEKNIPLHKRQAAVTENAPFVAGLSRYVDLIWEYDSVPPTELD